MFWKRDDALAEAEQHRTGFRVRGVLLGGAGADVLGHQVLFFRRVVSDSSVLDRTLESSDQWVRNGREREK